MKRVSVTATKAQLTSSSSIHLAIIPIAVPTIRVGRARNSTETKTKVTTGNDNWGHRLTEHQTIR